MKIKNILYAIPFLFLIFFIVLTILLICTSHRESWDCCILPTGLIGLNGVFPYFEYNYILDILSDVFMVIGLLMMLVMAGIGLYQLLKRKSLKKVDVDILLFGGSIIAMCIIWVLFETYPVSYRPHDFASSYPSTHVMIVTVTFFIFAWMVNNRLHQTRIHILTYTIAAISVIVTFILRMISGMHWFTDCLGGVCIGLFLVSTCICLDIAIKAKKQK